MSQLPAKNWNNYVVKYVLKHEYLVLFQARLDLRHGSHNEANFPVWGVVSGPERSNNDQTLEHQTKQSLVSMRERKKELTFASFASDCPLLGCWANCSPYHRFQRVQGSTCTRLQYAIEIIVSPFEENVIGWAFLQTPSMHLEIVGCNNLPRMVDWLDMAWQIGVNCRRWGTHILAFTQSTGAQYARVFNHSPKYCSLNQ
jgi:hypothetical protein